MNQELLYFYFAEAGGFEPPVPLTGTPVFKTGAFNHSATPPSCFLIFILDYFRFFRQRRILLRRTRPVPSDKFQISVLLRRTTPSSHASIYILYPLKADCGPEGNCPVPQLGTGHPEPFVIQGEPLSTLVDQRGIEPLTSALQKRRSTTELLARKFILFFKITFIKKFFKFIQYNQTNFLLVQYSRFLKIISIMSYIFDCNFKFNNFIFCISIFCFNK